MVESSTGAVYTDTIVPESNVVLLPLIANMDLLCGSDNLIEVADDGITFSLGDTDNASPKAGDEEQRLSTSNRVCSDKRVLCDHRVSADRATKGSRSSGLHVG